MDTPLEHLIAALRAAVQQKEELALVRLLKQPGLFASRTGSAGEALQWALRDGLLEITRKETKGKTETEWAMATPRGVQFLAQHESPKDVLQQLAQTLEINTNGLPRWVTDLQAQVNAMHRRLQEFLDQFTGELHQLSFRVNEALKRCETVPMMPTASSSLVPWQLDLLEQLRLRQTASSEPCPLRLVFPELQRQHPMLTVPAYHEGLLRLRDRGTVTLFPWPGALHSLEEPEFALLEDGVVYASVRGR
jgi:hypothetical protein